jgi:branched-chain amino acid transport system ATP-binding protein
MMLLELHDVATWYGASQALFGISLTIERGEVVTLLGRNGMGKTTTVNSICGLCSPHDGEILFAGRPVTGLAPHEIARLGVGLVPEGRRIFPNLTVRENLLMAERNIWQTKEPWTLGRVLTLFPSLSERLQHPGTNLSGGEQQMLAIGRALMTNPTLLILDEATEGLAPLVREMIWSTLRGLKAIGLSMILVDKDLAALSAIADRHYILEKGSIVWHGSNEELRQCADATTKYLTV